MKKLLNLLLVSALGASVFACGDDDDNEEITPTPGTGSVVELKGGTMAANRTLDKDTVYLIKDFLYVKAPATLTIEAGTIIKGENRGTIIIEKGAKINARGTAAAPIVFTSNAAPGNRKPGDWGGIIILGNAPVNLPAPAKIEGGVDREYGGTNAADNSGVLQYVRIEFSGIAFNTDNEINGLTMGGVGSGTTLDHIQISYNNDDSYEWFGGTVNAKHLVAYRTVDDMFDTDNGFSGKLQFLLGVAHPDLADKSGSNGFESDNNSGGTAATPQTSAIFSNVSLVGPRATPTTGFRNFFQNGMHIRRNSAISVHNSVIAGWPVGVFFDGSATEGNATSGTVMKFKNNVIAGNAANTKASANFNMDQFMTANGNTMITDLTTLNISSAFNLTTTPAFLPGAGSVLLAGASFTGLDAWFTPVTYKGAFGAEDWTTGWTNWDPQNTKY